MTNPDIKRFSPLAILGLAACGGGENAASGKAGTSAGVALKGPLANAIAFVDANNNKMLDTGETSVTTDANGNYSLANPNNHVIVVKTTADTVDTSSGAKITGLTLVGSSTDSVITPFTTIAVENAGVDLSAMATAMGLDGVDLSTFNPYADGVDSAAALSYEQTAQQVVSLLTVAGSALSSSGSASEADSLTAVFDALTTQVQSAIADGTTLDLTDTTLLTSIVTEAGADVGVAASAVSAAVTQVSEINTAIDKVQSLDLADAADAFSASTTLADLYDDDASAAAQASAADVIRNTAPTSVTLSANRIVETPAGDAAPTGAILIGTLTAVDDAEGTTLALSGADAALFEITDGKLYVKAGTDVNFEAQSSYAITVTATDALGETFVKNLTVEIINVDENGDLTYDATGVPIAGQPLVVTGTITDPDNVGADTAAGDVASITLNWYADGVLISSNNNIDVNTQPTLMVTDAMVGKVISAQVTYVDQAGNAGEFDVINFGKAIPDGALLNIQVFEGAQSAVNEFADSFSGLEAGIEAMAASLTTKAEAFGAAADAAINTENGVDIGLSSDGLHFNFGDYELYAGFSNFSPTSFLALEAAIEGFDLADPSTWVIDGGFNEIAIDGPDGSLFDIQFSQDDWGREGDTRDVLRLVNQNAPDGAVHEIGLIGFADNQLSSIIEVVASLAEINEDVQALYDNHYAAYPDYDSSLSSAENQAAYDAWEAEFDGISAQENALLSNAFSAISGEYDVDGFFVKADDEFPLIVQFGRTPDEDGENVVTISGTTHTLAIWGQFPDTAIDFAQALSYVATPENLDQPYDTVMADLADLGFEGIGGFGLYDENRDPLVRVTSDDFESVSTAVVNDQITIDLNGDTAFEYTTDDGVQSVIHDDAGQYHITGEGVDLETLYAFLDDDTTALV